MRQTLALVGHGNNLRTQPLPVGRGVDGVPSEQVLALPRGSCHYDPSQKDLVHLCSYLSSLYDKGLSAGRQSLSVMVADCGPLQIIYQQQFINMEVGSKQDVL